MVLKPTLLNLPVSWGESIECWAELNKQHSDVVILFIVIFKRCEVWLETASWYALICWRASSSKKSFIRTGLSATEVNVHEQLLIYNYSLMTWTKIGGNKQQEVDVQRRFHGVWFSAKSNIFKIRSHFLGVSVKIERWNVGLVSRLGRLFFVSWQGVL